MRRVSSSSRARRCRPTRPSSPSSTHIMPANRRAQSLSRCAFRLSHCCSFSSLSSSSSLLCLLLLLLGATELSRFLLDQVRCRFCFSSLRRVPNAAACRSLCRRRRRCCGQPIAKCSAAPTSSASLCRCWRFSCDADCFVAGALVVLLLFISFLSRVSRVSRFSSCRGLQASLCVAIRRGPVSAKRARERGQLS